MLGTSTRIAATALTVTAILSLPSPTLASRERDDGRPKVDWAQLLNVDLDDDRTSIWGSIRGFNRRGYSRCRVTIVWEKDKGHKRFVVRRRSFVLYNVARRFQVHRIYADRCQTVAGR
jgi:hypothetical protein